MSRRNFLSILVFFAVVVMVAAVVEANSGCNVTRTEKFINGNSLSGLVEHDSEVTAYYGYYACNDVRRDDVVLYDHPGNSVPIAKVIKAIPGDTWRLVPDAGGTFLEVNGAFATNSLGEPYFFTTQTVLPLYEADSRGVMPADSFIILGNLAGGTVDSTRFGFVHQHQLLAKVEISE